MIRRSDKKPMKIILNQTKEALVYKRGNVMLKASVVLGKHTNYDYGIQNSKKYALTYNSW